MRINKQLIPGCRIWINLFKLGTKSQPINFQVNDKSVISVYYYTSSTPQFASPYV